MLLCKEPFPTRFHFNVSNRNYSFFLLKIQSNLYLCVMFRIIVHIERLLLVHDCVIVPQFGGFVLQPVPPICDGEKDIFRPLRKEISFNSTLQHNDGLLPESYMSLYRVNFQQAQLMLEEDIEEVKAVLKREGALSLGVLGSFAIASEGQIVFSPGETDLFSVNSYGLPVFHFPALSSLQSVVAEKNLTADRDRMITPKKKDTVYIPVSRRLLRAAVGSVAAIGLFLLISTPVKDVNQAAYTASFIPTEMVAYKPVSVEVTTPAVVNPENSEAKEISSTEEISTEAGKKGTEKPVSIKEVSKEKINVSAKHTVDKTVQPKPKMYHIVIASFPSEAQADTYIAGVDKNLCKHVSKVVRDGKYRIYADKFDNRKEAEAYMATLRAHAEFKDAWLFITR